MGGVVDGAVPLVRAQHTPRELRKVGLPDHRGSRVERPLDDDRVPVGHMVRVDLRPVRRADACGVDEILDEERASRQRPRGGAGERLVQPGDAGVVRVRAHAHADTTRAARAAGQL
jgi:hypothetical protein